jgi:hypothetical protein
MPAVVLFGVPLTCGGANVEAGATALLWRRAGIEVTILRLRRCACALPTATFGPDNPWYRRVLEAGCRVVESEPGQLGDVPGLAGGIAVSFYNQHCPHHWGELRGLGCRVVWSPCMNYLAPHERAAFGRAPPAAVHFQSQYQRQQLSASYAALGCPSQRQYLIRGALDLSEFPYRPRPRQERTFRVGRLARADRLKWSRQLWPTLKAVRDRGLPLQAWAMGWTHQIEAQCGPAPQWARCFNPDTLPAGVFLSRCHVLLCQNGGAVENWPRVGLEAMASGVPVVAERRGGWLEMIVDGQTGLLYDTPAQCSEALTRLGTNEPLRLQIAAAARQAVEKLTDPGKIAGQWRKLLEEVDGRW